MSTTPEPAPDRWGERLPRKLGFWSAAAVLVGSTIGSGIFRTPAVVADRLDVVWLFLLAWILGGLVSVAGALAYAELATMMPRSGGMYVYLRQAFGKPWAFLFGWTQLLVLRPASYGAISITCSEYLLRVLSVDGSVAIVGSISRAQVLAGALLVMVGAVNYRGMERGAWVQNVSTVLKVGALLVLVALGLSTIGTPSAAVEAAPASAPSLSVVSAFGLAMVPILWSYDGWADVGFVSGEVKDPQRTLPRAFLSGATMVAVLYLAVTVAYLLVIPLGAMPGSKLIAADVASAVVGPVGVVLVSGAVALSTFGTLNGTMMTGPRIFYAMAEDRLFFRRLARVQPRYGTPGGAIVLSVVLGVVFVSIRSFAQLVDQFVIGIWPFHVLGVAAVFVLRRREPEADRPYRAWGYPWVPALFLLAAVFLLGNYLLSEPLTVLANAAVMLAGVPVYYAWTRRTAAAAARG
ncbi:APC family permease [Paraliomyxa miuraensis]|uniref:APC family permease n=1 Tax=Paraliomyxa miuraensis TaxID=376150 RepID=UPI002250A37F|nr:amino acid permease [Paraliomyxa miuraensis]MCX4245429.1 amino acid permease [Paraliomyxa miuraensis]